MVQIQVSQLRKALPEGVLRTRPPGYEVTLPPGALDLSRFALLAAEGRGALAAGEAARAADLLASALALGRGPPLAEFPEPFAAPAADRLQDARVACVEDRIAADLALGRHAGLAEELEALVARHPLRERLREELMLALYRGGRHAEALAAYSAFRARLSDDLGMEPTQRLRELQRRMLQQDPLLDPPAIAPARPRRPPPTVADVRYTRNGDVALAYQVVGEGPPDLILVHGWVC